jgi:hypothetical protein
MLRTIDSHRDETGVLVRTQHVRIPMCIQGDKLPTTCLPGSRLWGQVPTLIGSREKHAATPLLPLACAQQAWPCHLSS